MVSMLMIVVLLSCVIAMEGIVLDQQTYDMLFSQAKKRVASREQAIWLVPFMKRERPIDEKGLQSLDIDILKPVAETSYLFHFGSGDAEKMLPKRVSYQKLLQSSSRVALGKRKAMDCFFKASCPQFYGRKR